MSDFVNVGNKHHSANVLANCHLRPLAKVYDLWIHFIHGNFIPADCNVGNDVIFGYKRIGANALMVKDASYGSVEELSRNSGGAKIASRLIPQDGLVGIWHE